ncbi:hypothetical protein [Saccharomonospora xinjiangensis]|uniref:Uncharacterized protein n=1 Tax=Saccharomonospora xinjiangensis XJ-54 TaxID=882086 RepID=I0V222_9PSEU|nr:hypothetical protein [Saccharomonospora xinjiangensis]EID54175.1 hypothetical protein SacxiDRAFT_1938 [Saccharomonospora xinjiangensis XJ-54]
MTRRPELRAFLLTLDTETLVHILCEQADRDEELRQRLIELRGSRRLGSAEGTSSSGVEDAAAGARPADDAPGTARSARSDTVQLDSVLDTVQRLLDAGTSADVTPLARRTADRLVAAARESGDPSARLLEQLGRAVSLYSRACAAHPQPSRELAEWIIQLVFDSPVRSAVRLADFAEALGDDGLAWVRSAVDAVLADGGDSDRVRAARAVRLEIAEITSDVDTVVGLLSEELPRLDVSLRIVRVLRAAGRHSEAIAHAAKALGNGPVGHDGGSAPVVEALERVRTRQPPSDTSDVEQLLGADRYDEAWKVAADHDPSDVIPLYRQCVEQLIDSRNAQNYELAAVQLRRLRLLYRRAGISQEFSTYLAGLLGRHRRKTRLLDELRKARVALPKVLAG